jgi:hypothetical protein
MADQDLIIINDVAKLVGRVPDSLRRWDREGLLPQHLRPIRGPRNRRYWRENQINELKAWMIDNKMFPGGALPHIHLSQEEIEQRTLRTMKEEDGSNE